jgi:hypothetical protein
VAAMTGAGASVLQGVCLVRHGETAWNPVSTPAVRIVPVIIASDSLTFVRVTQR